MKKYFKTLFIIFSISIFLSSCSKTNEEKNTTSNAYENTTQNYISTEKTHTLSDGTVTSDSSEMFSDRDYEVGYSENESVLIQLNGNSVTSTSDSVKITGSTVTITEEATYIISGTLDDGMLIINSDEKAKPRLIFNNVNINSNTSAPIYILEADKVFITLAQDSVNSLSNGGNFIAIDDNNIDSVIFSKQDLTLNGSGELTINSPVGHGIVCKDDLVFTSGTYNINSATHGLNANDSVRIANADITITAGKDGIHSENSDDTTLGFVYISSGNLTIDATDDGIKAEPYIKIDSGVVNIIKSYEGLEALKIVINDGNINIVATDDGLNATGGSDSEGFDTHFDNNQFEDNTFDSDMYGIKPGGGMHDNKPGGVMHGSIPDNGMTKPSTSDGSINISGGTIYIKASGDGIDANGYLNISDGLITICGPTKGDTATLDYDTTATITGGIFIGTGASGMAQTFSDCKQGILSLNVGNQAAGTNITLKDSNNNCILSYTPELDFSVFIFSSPELKKGETYSLTLNQTTGTVIAE